MRMTTALGVTLGPILVATVSFIAMSATAGREAGAFLILGLLAAFGAASWGVYAFVVVLGSGRINARLVGFVIAAVLFAALVVVTYRGFSSGIDGN